jgi:hypothetical protein
MDEDHEVVAVDRFGVAPLSQQIRQADRIEPG